MEDPSIFTQLSPDRKLTATGPPLTSSQVGCRQANDKTLKLIVVGWLIDCLFLFNVFLFK